MAAADGHKSWRVVHRITEWFRTIPPPPHCEAVTFAKFCQNVANVTASQCGKHCTREEQWVSASAISIVLTIEIQNKIEQGGRGWLRQTRQWRHNLPPGSVGHVFCLFLAKNSSLCLVILVKIVFYSLILVSRITDYSRIEVRPDFGPPS